jgi:predicted MFS family arabinose efflux permease
MKMKDRLMLYITLGVLLFISLVLVGEYYVILYATNQTGEVIGTEPDVIALVQNALVGLIGIIGGYFGGKASKDE